MDNMEMRDKITVNYYHRLLGYIGWTERHILAGDEPISSTVRRFIAFPVWAPDVLRDFLEQRRPRALVVLAYFFALWIPYRSVWMIGDTGANRSAPSTPSCLPSGARSSTP